jgi:phosphate-selective porin OprO/OprP
MLIVFLAAAEPSAAQSASPSPADRPAPVVTGFDGGFFIQSVDGATRLTFGMVAQVDGRFSTDAPTPIVDTFIVRKARPMLTGRLAKYFDFKLVPDFGNGKAVVQDATIGILLSPLFHVRIGKDKTPIGYELLLSDPYLLFPERSLASTLVPNRDIGVSVQGDVARAKLSYAVGLYNGIPDGTSSTTDVDTNNAKDVAGRVIAQPFGAASSLHGLGVHFGASAGSARGPLPSFATSLQQTFFSYAGAAADGRHTRIAPALFYYRGPFGGFAEYIRSTQAVTGARASADVSNHAWDVSGSWLLTGETGSPAMIHPIHEFDPEKGEWGALQLVARYSALTIDPEAFSLGFAAAGASREARQFTIGANWLLNPFVKFYATYERTVFQGSDDRPAEHAIVFRSQLAFGDRR